jgi:hypothetical protein
MCLTAPVISSIACVGIGTTDHTFDPIYLPSPEAVARLGIVHLPVDEHGPTWHAELLVCLISNARVCECWLVMRAFRCLSHCTITDSDVHVFRWGRARCLSAQANHV